MNSNDMMQEWFTIAEKDLKSAQFLKGMHPTPLEIICYHCQQSVEKYLKGYMALQNEKIVRTHDLLVLNKKCRKYNSDFSEIEDECLRLTDYGVNVRYPFHFELTLEDVELAIKDAITIKEFILDKVE
ncbi:HEPN domain-containing protein [Selenihalanaerobacter shriftii]|uniref:HEPN domain-containing protein n=1 Tax=Selenihalanaerobacter shriftii TaxID=142842 RepID=A0A1T4NUA5_9FIRM|nr:HEPN domain-containing protein [Selenihalanaerobacter shriftii]SJZ82707.1 HEPN domain-containing protein [Selenihalanaerobacter shriftii]